MIIRFAIYDDHLNHDSGRSVREIRDWLNAQPGCEVRAYHSVCLLLRDIIDRDYRPDFAIIDLHGAEDKIGDKRLVEELFESARIKGFDIDKVINADLLEERNLRYWIHDSYYGIGVLALLRLVGCRVRMAYTAYYDNAPLLAVIYESNAANWGVCPKSDDIEPAKRRLSSALSEIRPMQVKFAITKIKENNISTARGPSKTFAFSITDLQNGLTAEVALDGYEAIVCKALLLSCGEPVAGKILLQAINKFYQRPEEFEAYSRADIRNFLSKFNIVLPGDRRFDTNRCQWNNHILCRWQQKGEMPQRNEDDGYECLEKTSGETGRGFCPKMQRKRVPPLYAAENRLSEGGGAERRIVGKLRKSLQKQLAPIFGADFDGKDLIREAGGKKGYVLAAMCDDE